MWGSDNNKDLGTYIVRVGCKNGESFDFEWVTETLPTHPSVWASEEELFDSIRFMFLEGNYSCDCNLGDFLARHKGLPDPDLKCGGTLFPAWIDTKRPDGTWIKLYSGVD